jgi:hypothetical protein
MLIILGNKQILTNKYIVNFLHFFLVKMKFDSIFALR